jgi:hypothetical protein
LLLGANFALKSWDPIRYAPLLHPGDNYCYDIYSQAAQAIRHMPQGSVDDDGALL